MLRAIDRFSVMMALKKSGVVVVMNKKHVQTPDHLVTTMHEVHKAGFVAEATLRIDNNLLRDAMPQLRELRDKETDEEWPFVLGVGSIICDRDRQFAAEQGFNMLVGPGNMVSGGTDCAATLMALQNRGYFLAPAAQSPTELQAFLTGAFRPDAIKIFPANVHGPKGLQGLLAPFQREEYQGRLIMPTGGVDHETGPKYAKAIAASGFVPLLGMSSPLQLVEEKKEPGNVQLIKDSLGVFIRKFLANNEGKPFGAIRES